MLFRSDRKSTRLNSSHTLISYAVFCLKKKNRSSSSGQRRNRNAVRFADTPVRMTVLSSLPASISNTLHPTHPRFLVLFFFFFNDTATTEIYPLSLHDALPI